jgi:DnaJ-class molecular chaperone
MQTCPKCQGKATIEQGFWDCSVCHGLGLIDDDEREGNDAD